MKRTILVLTMLLFPAAVLAQENGGDQQNSTATASAATSANTAADATSPPAQALLADTSPAAPAVPWPPQTTTPRRAESSRPPIQGSMVGYIDDPIVETQFRIRFDGAFGDQYPDRAEFFYGKCGCYRSLPPAIADPNAPGPPPGQGVIIPTPLKFHQL